MSEKIILGSNGIKRVLRKFSPVEAIAEYIWNGYDADATKIDVQIDANAIEGINKITIIDNGCGIDFRSLDKKFKPFYESNKMLYKNENNNSSLIHGKNGIVLFGKLDDAFIVTLNAAFCAETAQMQQII